MSKIMVVEDDASLREIYSIRITAEGYDVVSAGDGEEALAVAVREKPDLILSDVMMPKISGFDMLDILRATPETQNIKVIMMTALSSDEQRQRGERLGADRYLVKSQVGIEDVVGAIHDVLGDRPRASLSTDTQSTSSTNQSAPAPSEAQPAPQATSPTSESNQSAATPMDNPTTDPSSIPSPAPTVAQPAPVINEPVQTVASAPTIDTSNSAASNEQPTQPNPTQ